MHEIPPVVFDDFGCPKIGVAEALFARRIRFFGLGPMNEVGRGTIIEPAFETSCIEIILIAYTQDKGITDIGNIRYGNVFEIHKVNFSDKLNTLRF